MKNLPQVYKKDKELRKAEKKIVVSPTKGDYLDEKVIQKKYYNSFNYTMFPDRQKYDMTIGITSSKSGEGKTLVAANLAVSLALANQKKTVLVDLNFKNPDLHKIFGVELKPGLVESMNNGSVYLTETKIDQLFLLSAGNNKEMSIDLDNILSIRKILDSLKNEFEIIILDMTSVYPVDDFPAVFVNEIDGLLVVIDTKKTKYDDVDRVFKHITRDQTMGFIFNRVKDKG